MRALTKVKSEYVYLLVCIAMRKIKVSILALARPVLPACVLLTLIFTFSLACVAANGADIPKPVFIKTTCDGGTSSAVLSSLRNEIRTSPKYRSAQNLADGDQMGLVLTINMNCAERNDISAIATVFGRAKCFGITNCHLTIDGSSLRSDLCDSKAAVECGRALFKAFDLYMSNPFGPPLKTQ